MGVLAKVAKMIGYGQPKPNKDLFNGGFHKGKPHNPHQQRHRRHLDSDSESNDWAY